MLARLSLLVVVVWALGGSAAASAQVRTQTPVSGGTLNMAAEQSVSGYDIFAACCNTLQASIEEQPVLLSAFVQAPDGTMQPQLVTSVDVATSPSFTLTYHIAPNAVWSDGQPVTAQDFIFTWQTITNPSNNVSGTAGYNEITSMTALDSKTVRAVFSAPYAPWRVLFSPVLPSHALDGEAFDSIFQSGITDQQGQPIGDGPFLMTAASSTQVTLTRNPRWWGPHPAYLNSIVFKVVDTNTEEAGMANGQFQAIYPTTGAYLDPLLTAPGVAVQSADGPIFENLWFNISGSHRGPLEDQAWVRQAIADSIDRGAIAGTVFSPLITSLAPNQSLLAFPGQASYDTAFSAYSYSQSQVSSLMEGHGCSLGGDGIWVCGGQRMSFTVVYTQNNAQRQTEASMMRTEAQAAGIELVPTPVASNVIFGSNGIPGGNFQLAIFALITSGDPSDFQDVYTCGGGTNYGGFCDSNVDSGFATLASDLDVTQRNSDEAALDSTLAGDVPALPLFARPQLLFYSTRVHNLADNTTTEGPLWNAQDIWLGPLAAQPSISSFSPNHGGQGTVVTIDGTGFTGATGVTFGGTAASGLTVDSDTQMTATVGSGTVSSGAVAVTGPGGTGTSSDLFFAPPAITTMSPRSTASQTTPTVTVTGANFVGASQVKLGATSVSFTVLSQSQLTFTVPPGAVSGSVHVTTPGGTAASPQQFTVTVLPPQIRAFTPVDGQVGATVTVTGAHFTGVTGVSFNGTPAVSFLVVSDTVLTVVVPAGATSGHVLVVGANGSVSSAGVFTVLPAVAPVPVVSGFTPSAGPGGVRVVVRGSGFTGATSVGFNGRAAAFTVLNDATIYAYVPAGATAGPISVTTAGGTGTSATNFG